MKAEAATSEAVLEMEGQMLASRSSLVQRMQEEEQCAATYPFSAAATSQDGLSLEFNADIVGRQSYIQDASGRGL